VIRLSLRNPRKKESETERETDRDHASRKEITHLFVVRSMLAPLAEVNNECHYKITQKSESVRNRCPKDGCEDVHGVACY